MNGFLDRIDNCPMAEQCENCASEMDLNLETVETELGVFCLTLCDECTEFARLPKFGTVEVTVMALQHCIHLGITADRMGEELRKTD